VAGATSAVNPPRSNVSTVFCATFVTINNQIMSRPSSLDFLQGENPELLSRDDPATRDGSNIYPSRPINNAIQPLGTKFSKKIW